MNNEETEQLRQELEEMQSMHEDAMARINELTMDAEVARLEFEQVLDAMSDPTWVTNNDYEILRINSAFLDLLKVSRKEALRKKCFDLINCGHCNKGTCPMHQIKKKRQAIEMDVSLKIADRAEIPYLVTAMPFRGLTGEIIGMVQQFNNITEKRFTKPMPSWKIWQLQMVLLACRTVEFLMRDWNKSGIECVVKSCRYRLLCAMLISLSATTMAMVIRPEMYVW